MIIIRLCFMAAFPALRVTAVLRLKGGRPEDPVHHMDNTERQKNGQFRVANLLNVRVGKKQQQGKDLT